MITMEETSEGYEEVFLGAPLAGDGEAIFHRVTTESRADHSNEYKRNMILHLQKFDRAKMQGYLKATDTPVPNISGQKGANWSEKQTASNNQDLSVLLPLVQSHHPSQLGRKMLRQTPLLCVPAIVPHNENVSIL